MPGVEKLSGYINEGRRIVEKAEERKVTLRLMGAVAIVTHCPRFLGIFTSLEREITDLDFMGYSKESTMARKTLQDLGYSPKKLEFEATVSAHGGRGVFYNEATRLTVDVFFDRLSMCHTIDLRDRLKVDYPTISPADLLLEKLQIVKINEKDVKDVIVLLREHDVGKGDSDTINHDYISKILSDDWGFYFTVSENLKKISDFLPRFDALSKDDVLDVKAKIEKMSQEIENRPKSMRWRLRAKIGPARKWYEDVEEIVR